jgi:hypothetical protein
MGLREQKDAITWSEFSSRPDNMVHAYLTDVHVAGHFVTNVEQSGGSVLVHCSPFPPNNCCFGDSASIIQLAVLMFHPILYGDQIQMLELLLGRNQYGRLLLELLLDRNHCCHGQLTVLMFHPILYNHLIWRTIVWHLILRGYQGSRRTRRLRLTVTKN